MVKRGSIYLFTSFKIVFFKMFKKNLLDNFFIIDKIYLVKTQDEAFWFFYIKIKKI